jgi:phage shock protein E
MKPIYFIFAGLIAVSACSSNAITTENNNQVITEKEQNAIKNGVKTIKSAEVKNLLEKQKDLVILDVRTPEEFKAGHLKDAVLLNYNGTDFEEKVKALNKDNTYMVYCAVGGRSGKAAKLMQDLGFTKVYDATEGFNPLKEAGVSVEM